jgi:hypothetical protein
MIETFPQSWLEFDVFGIAPPDVPGAKELRIGLADLRQSHD